jgi:molecular chaperone GrpE
MREKMMRVAADFENFRRRSGKEVDDARKRGAQDMVKDLLAVFDNLERATSTVDDATDVAMIAEGLRMVHKQFIDVLGKRGIQRVDALGQAFDPSVHEAIQYDHSDTHAAGLVMNELQPGYVMGGQLLRPALVMVSRGPALAEIVEPEPEAAPTHVDAAGDGATRDAAADEASEASIVEDAAAANDGDPETAT